LETLTFPVETIETDVLCVGGGIAGLMAAIRASDCGAHVVVADKSNTVRSGSGGMGNDHFTCYIPEIHGQDIKPIIEGGLHSPMSGGWYREKSYIATQLELSFEIVKLWDSWGIPMKLNGRYEFAGHGIPGKPLGALKYAGAEQKPILTKQAIKRGVEILNRVMVFELLRDGSIIGAIGIDVRRERIIKFLAKSIFLGTGQCVRLYPSSTPGWMFNQANSPNATGDGRAMAYRAGAELVLMEIPLPWAGPKYLNRCGKGTWIGMLKDSDGKSLSPFLTRPERKYGDSTADHYPTIFDDYEKAGKGPIYMDCRGISDDDLEYMKWGLSNEGNQALLNNLKEENINLQKNPVEFTTYGKAPRGGIFSNLKSETSLKGLYSAGDENGVGIGNAAVYGWIAGENAASYAKQADSGDLGKCEETLEKSIQLISDIRNRKEGIGWYEANLAMQQVMHDYTGSVRSASLLESGMFHLQRLRQKTDAMLTAENQHETMRCMEVLNMFDVGEVIFVAALERKETRGTHRRADFPFANPLMEKLLIIKKADGKPVIEWRETKT
jgi:succinate dehydrogenase/fumarate reductase flavoprotein subunit